MATRTKQRYILLPPQGVRVPGGGVRSVRISAPLESFLANLSRPSRLAMRVRTARGAKRAKRRPK